MKVFTLIFTLFFLQYVECKPYKIISDDFNNTKTYKGKVFAKSGSSASAHMFGGDFGKVWALKIILGDNVSNETMQAIKKASDPSDTNNNVFGLFGEYFTTNSNSIEKNESLIVKINKDYYKYDLIYFKQYKESCNGCFGWVSNFGYYIPKSILEQISNPDNIVKLRVIGSDKKLTIDINPKKVKKLKLFLKSVKDMQ